MFDVTFLTSNWHCVFGNGCEGVLTGPAADLGEGCCSYGAHFVTLSERKRVKEIADTLTDDEWQMKGRLGRLSPIAKDPDGTYVTRLIDDACCFLNRPDGDVPGGCALHLAALNRGERPLDFKPDVCWQVPLRFEQSVDTLGHSTWTLREWKRRDWGAGGEDFHWWCTDAPDAFTGRIMVYESLSDEICELIGSERYHRLRQFLDGRPRTRFLPHPARRST